MSRSPRLTWRYRFSSLLQVFQLPRHIAPQRAHGLQSFYILTCFAEQSAVDAIPILRRNHRHVADSKIFVQAVKCRTGSSATTHGHRCSRLVNQQVFSRIEQTVKQGAKRAVRTGVIHRRPNDNSVGCFQFFSDFLIQFIVEHAVSQLSTTATGNATLNGFSSDGHNFRFHPILIQSFSHLRQSDECISFSARATVNKQNLHILDSYFLTKIAKVEGRKPNLFEFYTETHPILCKDSQRSILDRRTKEQNFHACRFKICSFVLLSKYSETHKNKKLSSTLHKKGGTDGRPHPGILQKQLFAKRDSMKR